MVEVCFYYLCYVCYLRLIFKLLQINKNLILPLFINSFDVIPLKFDDPFQLSVISDVLLR